MKHKDSLEGLVKNFDHELDEGMVNGHSETWYKVHINMIFLELCDIRDVLFVFHEVRKEWDRRAEQNAMSDIRIYPNWAIENISMEEVEKGMEMVSRLYEECFGSRLEESQNQIQPDDIIQTFFWM